MTAYVERQELVEMIKQAQAGGARLGVSGFLCVRRGNESVTSLSLGPCQAAGGAPVEACTHGSTNFIGCHFAPVV